MARIGIVGGGITGLYCAWWLLENDPYHHIQLFDVLDRLGGRIETKRFGGFKAECGPMRFELEIEPLLRQLSGDLEIQFVPFTPPYSGAPEFPKYELWSSEFSSQQEEATRALGKSISAAQLYSHLTTSLDLLRYGLYRIFNRDDADLSRKLSEVVTGDERSPSLMTTFCGRLSDSDYDFIRTEQELDGVLLHHLGFWNALERVLSPAAVAKIRDTGTFYHLLPENPSASEWSIFWLRLFRPDAALSTIKDGVDALTEKLSARLNKYETPQAYRSEPRLIIQRAKLIESVEADRKGVLRLFARGQEENVAEVDHLILAIPAVPMRELRINFPPGVRRYVDGVIPFPLVKVFAVVDHPWWDTLPNPQQGAHLVPTREIHYFRSEDKSDDRCMVMFYMDRPGTAYWRPYVDKPHTEAQVNRTGELKSELTLQLARLLPQGDLSAEDHLQRVEDSIVDYALRDWSEPPFGAACHAWLPSIDVPFALSILKAFALDGSNAEVRNVHICGEAYSDYQGFIEGSLRSAVSVIKTI